MLPIIRRSTTTALFDFLFFIRPSVFYYRRRPILLFYRRRRRISLLLFAQSFLTLTKAAASDISSSTIMTTTLYVPSPPSAMIIAATTTAIRNEAFQFNSRRRRHDHHHHKYVPSSIAQQKIRHQPFLTTTTTTTTSLLAFQEGEAAEPLRKETLASSSSSSSSSFHTRSTTNRPHPVPPEKSLRHALGLPPPTKTTTNTATTTTTTTTTTPPPPLFPPFPRPRPPLIMIIGHRGALYDELENTRESFLRCAELGCHGIELDAFLLKDGNVVVFHGGEGPPPGDYSNHVVMMMMLVGQGQGQGGTGDYSDITGGGSSSTSSTSRSSTSSTSIMDLTYPQVQELCFNPCYKEFTSRAREKLNNDYDYRIPLLKDVLLDMKKTNLHVKIELKGHSNDIVQPVIELVEQLDMVEQCSYSSFDHDQLRTLRNLRPDLANDPTTPGRRRHLFQTGALFDGYSEHDVFPVDFVRQALDAGADQVHLRYDACTVDRIAQIHDAGLASMAWFRGPLSMQSDLELRFWDVGTCSATTSSTSASSDENPQTGDGVQFLEDAACYRTVLETGVQQICVNRPDIAMAMQESLSS